MTLRPALAATSRSLGRPSLYLALLSMLVAAALFAGSDRAEAAGTFNTIATLVPFQAGADFELDADGNPVIAYGSTDNSKLSLLHCDDPDCAPGGESVEIADPLSGVGMVDLALDASGYPVIAYSNFGGLLDLVHCNDPDCAGGGETYTGLGPPTAIFLSLELDSAGSPVLAYGNSTGLHILHCNDANCAPGGDSTSNPDAEEAFNVTLKLDAAGYPVVSYYNYANEMLRVLRCDDPNCTGGGETITSPEPDVVSYQSSLVLDGSGRPVIGYSTGSWPYEQRILRCDDIYCAPGGDTVVTIGTLGSIASVALDAAGNPVVSYAKLVTPEFSGAALIMHCNDANCAGGDDSVSRVDWQHAGGGQIRFDSAGNPIVVYGKLDDVNRLKVLHCADPNCNGDIDLDGCIDAYEVYTTPGFEAMGGKRSPKNPYDFYDTNGDGTIDLFIDIFNVANAFGDDADSVGPGEPDGYDATLDRSAAPMGMDPWDTGPPDGLIDLFADIFGVAYQFGHACS